MNNTAQPSPSQEDALSEEVATWFLRLQAGDCSAEDRRAFEAWLAESEAHRTEYEHYVELWQSLDQLGQEPKRASRKKMGMVVSFVAGLAFALGTAQWYISLGENISTAVGERRHVVLADGTAVDLNTDSKIRVKMTDGLRKVTLVQGEALLGVAHEARPFEVHAGAGVLRDIGTTFNVRRDDEQTTVAVLDGEVLVNLDSVPSVNLHGGQQVGYATNGLSAVSPVNAADVTAWLGGRLVFREAPLTEVVKQINRYHSRPVELADEQLGSLKVSGEFNSADRDGLIQALKMLLSLSSTEHLGSTELFRLP
ncbi:MAG: FecR family protein [Gallionella sp.]|nr:FecR family protein [Gallionella sp.]